MAEPQGSSIIYEQAPIIVLAILAIMMAIPTTMIYDPVVVDAQIAQVQAHFIIGAFLIPICLILAVQTFGIPKINQTDPSMPPPPLIEAISQSFTASIVLVVVIFLVLMLIPLRFSVQPR